MRLIPPKRSAHGRIFTPPRMKNLPSLLLLLLLAVPAAAPAQGSEIFPPERRQELREEVRYEAPEREETPDTEYEPIDWSPYRTPALIVLGILFATGMALLAYRLFRDLRPGGGGTRARNAAVPVEAEEIVEEQIVAQGVAPDLLARAEAAGQYEVAIRLLYLGLLKELQDARLIRWRRDFSNRDYRRQLTGHPLAADFQQSTEFYERYWYGKYPIDRLAYRVAHTKMRALQARIAEVGAQTAHP